MLWEIEIQPKGHDPERQRVAEEYDLLSHSQVGATLIAGSARGYLLEGDLLQPQAELLAAALLVDPLAQTGRVGALNGIDSGPRLATVLLKPGVMDPTAQSVVEAVRDLGIPLHSVRTFRRYFGPQPLAPGCRELLRKVFANEAIEQAI
jgi:hypothetical protein